MAKKIIVPFKEDKRMIYAENYLEERGYEIVSDKKYADYVLLPIPVKKYMLDGFEDKTVLYGAGDYEGIDYNKNETFLLKNAYLTAEGAVALYKETSGKALFGSKILITGYGRIASALHSVLNSFGSEVTVCSRSSVSRTKAVKNGAKHITFESLRDGGDYDAVFNTVPHMIFTKNELDALNADAVIFDLASFPGGVDTLYAKAKNIKLIDGRRLPARYSIITAGRLIGETAADIIEEGVN